MQIESSDQTHERDRRNRMLGLRSVCGRVGSRLVNRAEFFQRVLRFRNKLKA
ncbi:uncharacterized protein L969DRAFT_89781 [Mixia osmundae IAM 14324]|uniref:uncharacterized protein n=1 Tax=Mixia osmundae (strain CBS 9802 / IAM 14324 / JCM 22182 / KY 12970) TaxID=764103 RepID=UPI0004A55347|nr:uncharacterized protein L969DRAFT_91063 [Mixia osmundae IAM 14324]XP_014566366.1 uncharacterized protein L969DRAFT_89781 [Mixia osmundae IAM 14324]KEI36420.1 hypothetical protein L969DRAFT_91063 [Mixia osmundae IAM 14324]KEI37811.1 hypothetical protein L969DRAFT_89781 [Mixia osmundae IAM 14324]